ncbi:hypothetical protein ACFE04_002747 [Oxalis oulophora]
MSKWTDQIELALYGKGLGNAPLRVFTKNDLGLSQWIMNIMDFIIPFSVGQSTKTTQTAGELPVDGGLPGLCNSKWMWKIGTLTLRVGGLSRTTDESRLNLPPQEECKLKIKTEV